MTDETQTSRVQTPAISHVMRVEDLLSWESQERQYKPGPPGLTYTLEYADKAQTIPVDCLVYRNSKGRVIGILNHYPCDTTWEVAGNVNIWVHPRRQRRGIGTILLTEAIRRWGTDLTSNGYTEGGLALGRRLGLEPKPSTYVLPDEFKPYFSEEPLPTPTPKGQPNGD